MLRVCRRPNKGFGLLTFCFDLANKSFIGTDRHCGFFHLYTQPTGWLRFLEQVSHYLHVISKTSIICSQTITKFNSFLPYQISWNFKNSAGSKNCQNWPTLWFWKSANTWYSNIHTLYFFRGTKSHKITLILILV